MNRKERIVVEKIISEIVIIEKLLYGFSKEEFLKVAKRIMFGRNSFILLKSKVLLNEIYC